MARISEMFWNIVLQSMSEVRNLMIKFGGVTDATNIALQKAVHNGKTTECKVKILGGNVYKKSKVGATTTICEEIEKRWVEDPYGVMAIVTTLQNGTKPSDY